MVSALLEFKICSEISLRSLSFAGGDRAPKCGGGAPLPLHCTRSHASRSSRLGHGMRRVWRIGPDPARPRCGGWPRAHRRSPTQAAARSAKHEQASSKQVWSSTEGGRISAVSLSPFLSTSRSGGGCLDLVAGGRISAAGVSMRQQEAGSRRCMRSRFRRVAAATTAHGWAWRACSRVYEGGQSNHLHKVSINDDL
jgi:hypothetical protein